MGCGASNSSSYTAKDTVQLSKPTKKRLGGEGTAASPTLWVGGIPAGCANPDALQKVFQEYGHVLSIKVRYKPGENKSWAFVTLDTTGNATKAIRSTVTVVDRAKSTVPVELNVSAADVAGERERVKALADAKQRKQTDAEDEEDEWDEWGKKPKELVEAKRKQRRRSLQSDSQRLMGLGFEKSAREKLWAEEQKVIASNHARNERVARAEAKEQAEKMASLLDAKAPWTCDVCQKSMPRSKEVCGVCRRGKRPKGLGPKPKPALTVSTVAVSNYKSGGSKEAIRRISDEAAGTAEVGSTIHADSYTASKVRLMEGSGQLQQQLSTPWCTAWVGDIPTAFLGIDDDTAKDRLSQLFDEHGKILGVTVRRKKDGSQRRGSTGSFKVRPVYKNWALVTFDSALGVRKAVKAGATARVDGREVSLKVRPSRLEQELKRSDTGALAGIWQKQEREVAAACTIQAIVRKRQGKKAKQRRRPSTERGGGGGGGRRRSSQSEKDKPMRRRSTERR